MVRPKEVALTKHDAARKQRIIEFIAETVRQRGYPPSVREIAEAVGLASTSAVHHHRRRWSARCRACLPMIATARLLRTAGFLLP